MEGWSGIALTAVTSTGNLTQVYPTTCTAGIAKASATNGQLIRGPTEGILYQVQIETDGTNGGTIELWDANGDDAGADVSSAATVTNAQLVTLQSMNVAKLIYRQNFQAAPTTPFGIGSRAFQRGLLARFVASAGTCYLNMSVQGGCRKTEKVG